MNMRTFAFLQLVSESRLLGHLTYCAGPKEVSFLLVGSVSHSLDPGPDVLLVVEPAMAETYHAKHEMMMRVQDVLHAGLLGCLLLVHRDGLDFLDLVLAQVVVHHGAREASHYDGNLEISAHQPDGCRHAYHHLDVGTAGAVLAPDDYHDPFLEAQVLHVHPR